MKVLCVSPNKSSEVTFDLDMVIVTDKNVPTGYAVEVVMSNEEAVAEIIALRKKGYTVSEFKQSEISEKSE